MKIMLTSKLQILLEKYDRKNFREWGAEKINIMAKIVGRVTYNHQAYDNVGLRYANKYAYMFQINNLHLYTTTGCYKTLYNNL